MARKGKTTRKSPPKRGTVRVATCQFPERFDPDYNAKRVIDFLARAKRRRAELVHFHEAAMTGYFTHADADTVGSFPWDTLRSRTQEVCREAGRLGLWVVLGSAHPLTGRNKPTNCLYLIGPDGSIRDRYDKRFCTTGDLRVYSPGDHDVIFTLNGVRCALLICFDVRFPELYRRMKSLGVEGVFQSFHNAYCDGPGIHDHIMRPTVQAMAGLNYLFISSANASGRYCRHPSAFITPDGKVADSLPRNRAGMMVNTIDTSAELYNPTEFIRKQVTSGQLYSGQPPADPRRTDRTSL